MVQTPPAGRHYGLQVIAPIDRRQNAHQLGGALTAASNYVNGDDLIAEVGTFVTDNDVLLLRG